MLSIKDFKDILSKYPELIDPALTFKARDTNLYDLPVDILFEDKYRKRLVVQVKTAVIEKEHLGEVLAYKEAILSAEAPNVSVMLVANKIPPHLQKTCEHNGVAWKEINLFQIEEHLAKKGDMKLLKLLKK